MPRLTMDVHRAFNVMGFVWMKIMMIVWTNVSVQSIMICVVIDQQRTFNQSHKLQEKSK